MSGGTGALVFGHARPEISRLGLCARSGCCRGLTTSKPRDLDKKRLGASPLAVALLLGAEEVEAVVPGDLHADVVQGDRQAPHGVQAVGELALVGRRRNSNNEE